MSNAVAISLFSGAGGLDLGAEAAGFETRVAVESADIARSTMLANAPTYFPSLSEDGLFDDVLTIEPEALLEHAGVRRGEPGLLVGGPPCTPFSKSGYWLAYKRAGSDPKASLLDEYVRLLDGTQPMSFTMENVYGLAYRNQNRAVLDRFLDGVRAAGYAAEYRILLAADFGVPQLRQRLFCVGVRKDLLDVAPECWHMRWPSPTHAGPHETKTAWDKSLPRHVSSGEALSGLIDNPEELEEHVTGTYAEELHAVPPGENYLYWTTERGHPEPRFKWRSRYWSFLLKLDPDRPSPTIQGQPGPWVGPFHWDSRRLRVAELKRLMAFPEDFVVLGSRRDQQLQLGNAVPPHFAQAVIGALADELARLGATPSLSLAA
ncbi:MAG TPA: DNA cytosine methyltransferase [Solirubrobacteraceae bacterium]|jgi:DNA (cytosine-5)-methyltransferase 1|nr:DNA cytosine methyltransferase [Solirubrobacteraceae bacterium]